MSLSAGRSFSVGDLPIDGVDAGTSVLLTGDDSRALEAAFYHLVAPEPEERAAVLSTDTQGRSVRRSLDRVAEGAADRTSVLAGTGRSSDGVQAVDDLADLAGLGMTFTSMVAEAQQGSGRFRSGILLCSSVCAAADDIRSVYRMLNSNFLPELRRGDGIGVCALDTSVDFGSTSSSVVKGMTTSFNTHITVESDGRDVSLDLSDFGGSDRSTVSL
ncbi:DUF7504 family protein [Halobaculum lipolyticum]|uniref:RecA-superfamily ATPase, KaiC/GvpD/RAD55 family n=1 Tax=Halobaculum lipolyticum TaxID=3032001 RepID=A0ABD5WFG4_9EURY|nr:hypothetical protein [Halobaculum sp. DT31]